MWKLIPGGIIMIAGLCERSYKRSETLHAVDKISAKLHHK